MTESKESTVRLLITCPDQPGIVAAVSGYLHKKNANIIPLGPALHRPEGGRFFMRNEFFLPGLDMDGLDALRREFEDEVTSGFVMDWSLNPVWKPKKMVILCSKVDHALMELLWRWKRGDLEADISWSSPTTRTCANPWNISCPSTTCPWDRPCATRSRPRTP